MDAGHSTVLEFATSGCRDIVGMDLFVDKHILAGVPADIEGIVYSVATAHWAETGQTLA